MYRSRGRPDDPVNIRIEEKNKSLAGFIQVNNLSSALQNHHLRKKRSSIREMSKRRNNFGDLKKIYEEKVRLGLEEEEIDCNSGEPEKRGVALKSRGKVFKGSPAHNKARNQKIPLPTVTKTIYEMKVQDEPVASNSTKIVSENKTKSQKNKQQLDLQQEKKSDAVVNTNSILMMLQALEKTTDQPGSDGDLFRELEDAKEQVDVAALQLEHINQLISKKGKSTAKEPEDKLSKLIQEKNSTKWQVPNSKNSSSSVDKKKKLVSTLNTLNLHLQRMEEKMQKYRHKYRSINDFFPVGTSVEVLFKNVESAKKLTQEGFMNYETVNSGEEEMSVHELVDSAVECHMPSKKEQTYNSSAQTENTSVSESKEPKSTQEKPVNFLMEPNPAFEEVEQSKYNLISPKEKLAITTKVTMEAEAIEFLQGREPVFDEELEKSILKSDFLMREFRPKCGIPGVPFPLESEYTSTLLQKIAQVKMNSKPQSVEGTPLHRDRRDKARMYLNNMLQNSLYSCN